MNKKIISLLAIVLGCLLVVSAVVYFMTPAQALPTFFPGYDALLLKHHVTHGVAAFCLGIGCFAFAWMNSGKPTTSQKS